MPFGLLSKAGLPAGGPPKNTAALPLLPSRPTPTCSALWFWLLHQSLGTGVGTRGDKVLPHRATRISSVCPTQEPEGLTTGGLPQSAWEERSSRGWVPAPAGNRSRIEAGKGKKIKLNNPAGSTDTAGRGSGRLSRGHGSLCHPRGCTARSGRLRRRQCWQGEAAAGILGTDGRGRIKHHH